MRVLLLGGTAEARQLAARLADAGIPAVSSLAGRVRNPRLPVGEVRIGGFGGADGLAAYLRDGGFDAVLDATHPFAAAITRNAAQACGMLGVPLIAVRRPAWSAQPGDDWIPATDIAAAAALVRDWPGRTVFLTTGRRDLAVFAGDVRHRYIVRAVDPPEGPVPADMTLILDRGPYDLAGETAILIEHGAGLLVTKNSGGGLTAAKLAAARSLGLPVIMVARPPLPAGVVAEADVDAALRRLLDAADQGADEASASDG